MATVKPADGPWTWRKQVQARPAAPGAGSVREPHSYIIEVSIDEQLMRGRGTYAGMTLSA